MKVWWFAAPFIGIAVGLSLGALLVLAADKISEHRGADAPRVTIQNFAVGPGAPDGESRPGSVLLRIDVSGSSGAVVSIQTRRHWDSRRLVSVALVSVALLFTLAVLFGTLAGFWFWRALR